MRSQPSALAGANIACVGAGPASVYFAILAKSSAPSRRITIYERRPESAAVGWGVTIYLDALEATDPTTARQIADRAFAWRENVIHVAGRPAVSVPTPGTSIGRRALLEILIARARELGVEFVFEHEISSSRQLAEADLIVAADGLNSLLREEQRAAFGSTCVHGANKFVWLGTNRVFDAFTFPFVKTPAGWVWAYAYGFDRETSTFIVEMAGSTWAKLGFDRLSPAETLRQLEAIFASWLEGQPLRPPPDAGDGVPWLEFQTITNRSWHAGKLVLMGDAAHTTHFTIGSGTRLAIADAIELASQLGRHSELSPALAAYGSERSQAVRGVQQDARNSAAWFERLARYIERDPQQFAELLYARSSRLLPYLPPRLYLWLRNARA